MIELIKAKLKMTKTLLKGEKATVTIGPLTCKNSAPKPPISKQIETIHDKINDITKSLPIPCNDPTKTNYRWINGTCYFVENGKSLNFEDAQKNCAKMFGPYKTGILFEVCILKLSSFYM